MSEFFEEVRQSFEDEEIYLAHLLDTDGGIETGLDRLDFDNISEGHVVDIDSSYFEGDDYFLHLMQYSNGSWDRSVYELNEFAGNYFVRAEYGIDNGVAFLESPEPGESNLVGEGREEEISELLKVYDDYRSFSVGLMKGIF